MKVMEFVLREFAVSGYCIDAKNPYIWRDCGKITVRSDANEADVERAKREAGIPDRALCIKAYET